MQWEKTVKDAALATLAAVVGLFAFMILTLCLFFPVTMMHITSDLGMDSSCLSFAKRAYKATDDVYYIGFALDTAVRLEDEKEIVKCAEQLIEDKGFAGYCELRDDKANVLTSYEQYVYGQICVSMYEMGEKEEAIARAFAYTVGFPRNNAVYRMAYCATTAKDSATMQTIKEKLQGIDVNTLNETEKSYYADFLDKIG